MPGMSEPAVEAFDLCKYFGRVRAVEDLQLRIERGEFYGLLGPNGAGKSTTLALLTGVLRPSAGRIRLLGRDFDADAPWFKQRMGVVEEQPALFSRLRGHEQLLFVARMYGLREAEAKRRSGELLGLLGLAEAAHTLVADMSRGMRKKLALACALVHAPALLVLDEPFEGLDAFSAETARGLLSGMCARGATVLLTTHILEIAERLCSRVGIICRGRLVSEQPAAGSGDKARSLREIFFRTVGEPEPRVELPAWLEPTDGG